MGSFTLTSIHSNSNKEAFRQLQAEKGIAINYEGRIGEYDLYHSNKRFVEEDAYLLSDGAGLFTAGTFIYKQAADLTTSLHLLLTDLLNNNFSYTNIRGHFVFLFTPDFKNIFLATDRAGVQNLFYDTQLHYISSSFSALAVAYGKELQHDKQALTETLVHGYAIGPDTIYEQIKRFEPALNPGMGSIKLLKDDSPQYDFSTRLSFNKEVDRQIDCIDDYFNDTKAFLNTYGVDLGLSDGHDSRLLASFVQKHISNARYYTFWRKKKNKEIEIAENVSKVLNKELIMEEGHDALDKNEAELKETFDSAFHFYDGLPKMHCYFHEDFNTISFREKFLDKIKIGFNGIGGEQYRNDEHLIFPSYNKRFFIQHILTYQKTGKCVDQTYEEIFFKNIESKISRLLHSSDAKSKYSRQELKVYYNEIFVNAVRSNRINAENQFAFFLSPLLDAAVIRESYKAYQHLGVSFTFQQEMIRRLSPELANVVSGYGYTFAQGEPLKDKVRFALKSFVPSNLLIRKAEQRASDNAAQLYIERYPFIKDAYREVEMLQLPVDLKLLMRYPDRWPVVISLGFTLSKIRVLRKSIEPVSL
jgi:hypothetical protein